MQPDLQPQSLPGAGLGAGALWQVLVALLLTSAVAILVLRLVRQAGAPARTQGHALRVVAQVPLSASHSVHLLYVAGRYLLLGSAQGSLSLLTEVDPAQADEALQRDVIVRHASRWHRFLRGGGSA